MTATTANRPPGPQGGGRVDQAFRNARRHSALVRVLKLALPALALLMVGGFVAKSWIAAPDGISIDLSESGLQDGKLVMADPTLDGFTPDNRAYKMTAARAIQAVDNASRVDLEEIEARLPINEKDWLSVVASSGVFHRDENRLDLDSEVVLETDTGIKAVLGSAKVDIGAGTLETDEPVDITLEGGRIEADSLTVKDRGAVMVFENRVRMEIDPRSVRRNSAEGSVADAN